MVNPIFKKLEANKLFTEREAWGLFRLFTLAEAFGWTILIAGILIDRTRWRYHGYAVPIAGQIHGMIFLTYFAIVLATYGSLGWSRKKFIISLACGVPPYGTLLFEVLANQQRRNQQSRRHYRSLLLATLSSGATTD